MDVKSFPLHLPEPGHLTLGKLVDGNIQTLKHRIIIHLALYIQGQKFIFQAVANQLVLAHTLVNQCLHFFHHAALQTLFQTAGDA